MSEASYKALVVCAAWVLTGIGCSTVYAGNPPNGQDFTEIERGRYLTAVADCAACHTDPDGGLPFAAGRPIETPFGIVVAANITPDRETGVGNWTGPQFEPIRKPRERPSTSSTSATRASAACSQRSSASCLWSEM
jgi:hypothetical protein